MKKDHKGSRQRPFDQKDFERRIVDAFVKHHLGDSNNHYQFVSRPDETQSGSRKLPDFHYADTRTNDNVILELGRITCIDASHHMSIYKEISSMCDELAGRVSGTLWIGISHNRIPQPRTGNIKKRNQYMQEVRSKIQKKSKKINEGGSFEVDGMKVLKVSTKGSAIYFFSVGLSPVWTKDISRMIDLLEETSCKFKNYELDNSRNILLLLHKGPPVRVHTDIGIFIKDLKAGLYGKENRRLAIFHDPYDVYVMFFDVFWGNDISVSRCYPSGMSAGLCPKSHLFKNPQEHFQFLKEYFPG